MLWQSNQVGSARWRLLAPRAAGHVRLLDAREKAELRWLKGRLRLIAVPDSLRRDAMIIVQITDLHVVAKGRLFHPMISTNTQLVDAVTHINSLDPRPDVVIVSGDLTEHGLAEEYDFLRDLGGLDSSSVPSSRQSRSARGLVDGICW